MTHIGEREWKTRKERIDPRLDALGWKLAPSRDAYRTEEHPTEHGPADYVLHLDGAPIAVIEAKKLTVGPQNVLTQAQRYARGLTGSNTRFGEYRVPFLYSTNGEVTWFHDVRHPLNLSRPVGHLVDDDPFRLSSSVRMNGVFLAEGEEVGVVDRAVLWGLER